MKDRWFSSSFYNHSYVHWDFINFFFFFLKAFSGLGLQSGVGICTQASSTSRLPKTLQSHCSTGIAGASDKGCSLIRDILIVIERNTNQFMRAHMQTYSEELNLCTSINVLQKNVTGL